MNKNLFYVFEFIWFLGSILLVCYFILSDECYVLDFFLYCKLRINIIMLF